MLRRFLPLLALLALPAGVQAQSVVDASAPENVSVTAYRDPERRDQAMERGDLGGFALISETRSVTLPPGRSTIRFTGVSEGMVAITAIVAGLPGGLIEMNRNADLLSPASLVDGTLGNRVTITRTNPATGARVSQDATVRTRADGGLVLQTREGLEAVRCSGLPEGLSYRVIPAGLSPLPVFSVDASVVSGGTYKVTLTYISSGFDWEAQYVSALEPGQSGNKQKLRMHAWLTLANDNGQSFADAELLAVAGDYNNESDFENLAEPPEARPLQLTCYPLGSTSDGTPIPIPPPPPQEVSMPMAAMSAEIIVTAQKRSDSLQDVPMAVSVIAGEEALGDLKLFRIPERMTVAANATKQVAFLTRPDASGDLVHRLHCTPGYEADEPRSASMWILARNDTAHGLGQSLPYGKHLIYEDGLVLTESTMHNAAVGQEMELPLVSASRVQATCTRSKADADAEDGKWHKMQVLVENRSGREVVIELNIGQASDWQIKSAPGKLRLHYGSQIVPIKLTPGQSRKLTWRVRHIEAADE